jgi:hypothetical protein
VEDQDDEGNPGHFGKEAGRRPVDRYRRTEDVCPKTLMTLRKKKTHTIGRTNKDFEICIE